MMQTKMIYEEEMDSRKVSLLTRILRILLAPLDPFFFTERRLSLFRTFPMRMVYTKTIKIVTITANAR